MEHPPERIERMTLYTEIVNLMAKRSGCHRGQVGAILVKDGRIISSGYNGPVAGDEHCTQSSCDLDHSCKRAVHAEANAIFAAAKFGTPTQDTTLYCTTAPCLDCAKAIVQAGIHTVYYLQDFRTSEGVELLQSLGITISQIGVKTQDNN